MKKVLYPENVISEKLKEAAYKKKDTITGEEMAQRRNNIIMVRLPTPKKVVRLVGKTFIAKYERKKTIFLRM